MLGEVHVAIFDEGRIVADLDAAAQPLTEMLQRSPGQVSFISGPSRTADIERVLAIGVHGPQELHILIRKDR